MPRSTQADSDNSISNKHTHKKHTSLPSEDSCGALVWSQQRQLVVPGSQSGMGAEHWSSSVRSFSTKETTMILSTASGCHHCRSPALQDSPPPPPAPLARCFGKGVPLAPQSTKPTTSLRLLSRRSTHTLGVYPSPTCTVF